MKKIERDFIELTKRAISCNYLDDSYFVDTDWNGVLELAHSNKLSAVLYDVVKVQNSVPEDVRKKWDMERFETFVKQKKHFHALMDLLKEMTSEGIEYALFKGLAIAEAYPNPDYRSSTDSDILVDEKDRPLVSSIIEKRGYIIVPEKCKDKVFVYFNENTGHIIELHTSIFEDYEGKKIDVLKKAEIENPQKYICLSLADEEFTTFGINEHLIYQFFHLIKHFILEGAGIRFFTDIVCFIKKNKDKIDSDYFWEWMEKCEYTEFCENFFAICVEYFGMDSFILEGHDRKYNAAVLEELLVDFIYKGDEGKLRGKSWQLTTTLEPFFVGERQTVDKSKSGRIIHFIFPKPEELNDSYFYAKKIPILLPVAWIHRIVKKIIWQIFLRKEESYTGIQKMEVVQSRLGLLGKVGLLDEL